MMAVFPNVTFLCVLEFNYEGFPWVKHYCLSLCAHSFPTCWHGLHLTPLHQSTLRGAVEGEKSYSMMRWGLWVLVTIGGTAPSVCLLPSCSPQGFWVLKPFCKGDPSPRMSLQLQFGPSHILPTLLHCPYSLLSHSYCVLDPCGLLYFQMCVL